MPRRPVTRIGSRFQDGDSAMKAVLQARHTLAIVAGMMMLAGVACGSDADPPATSTPSSPTSSPTVPSTLTSTPSSPTEIPTPTPVPAITETGIEVIDAYLAAREAGDLSVMTALVRTHKSPCGGPDYSLACPPGASQGTLVDAFPWWGCHGPWSNQGTLQQAATFVLEREGELRTVVRFDPAPLVASLPSDVTIAAIFEETIAGESFAWAVIANASDGGIYGWVSGCVLDVPGLLAQHFPGATVVVPAP